MHTYIIANIHGMASGLSTTDGYRLLDSDANKILDVTKDQLIQAVDTSKIKIYNAKLVDGHLQGTYYSLSLLPELGLNTYVWMKNNRKARNQDSKRYIILKHLLTNDYLTFDYTTEQLETLDLGNLRCRGYSLYLNINEAIIPLGGSRRNKVLDIDILCENEKKQIASISDLDKQVGNPAIVWDMATFDTYMKSHNYAYECEAINLLHESSSSETIYISNKLDTYAYKLRNISSDCKIVHIPANVIRIRNLYDKEITQTDTIIFGPDVKDFYTMYDIVNPKYTEAIARDNDTFDHLVDVNNIYFQKAEYTDFRDTGYHTINRAPRMSGLYGLNIKGVASVPYSVCVSTIYNRCKFSNNVDIPDYVYRVATSFNGSTFRYNKLEINTNYIANSFFNTNLSSVVFGDKICELESSFSNNESLSLLDFSKAKQLHSIDESFNDSVNLMALDLRASQSNIRLYKSFNDCKSLMLLTYNKLSTLNKSLHNCQIHKLKFDSSITLGFPVLSKGDEIELSKIEVLRSNFFDNYNKADNIKLTFLPDCNIGQIANRAFYSIQGFRSFNELGIKHSIRGLSEGAFNGSSFSFFNSMDFPLVRSIPKECFEYASKLEVIALDSNIEIVGEGFLNSCTCIRDLVLADTVKFSTNAIDRKRITGSFVFHVVAGSDGEKLAKLLKFPIEYINSNADVQVVYNDIISHMQSSDIDIAKAKLLLSNSEFSELTDSKYASNAGEIISLVTAMTDPKKCSENILTLNDENFVQFPLSSNINLQKFILDNRKVEAVKNNTSENLIHSDTFIGLCNFFTGIMGKQDYLTASFFNNIKDTYISVDFIIYADRNDTIFKGNLATTHDTRLKTGVKASGFDIIMIISGDFIRYISPLSMNHSCQNAISELSIVKCRDNVASIAKNLKQLDKLTISGLSIDSIINGHAIPYKYNNDIKKQFYSDNIFIGLSRNKLASHTQTLDMYTYCIPIGLINRWQAVLNINLNCKVESIQSLVYYGSTYIENITKLNTNITDNLLKGDNIADTLAYFKALSLSDADIDNLKKLNGAYDTTPDIITLEVANRMASEFDKELLYYTSDQNLDKAVKGVDIMSHRDELLYSSKQLDWDNMPEKMFYYAMQSSLMDPIEFNIKSMNKAVTRDISKRTFDKSGDTLVTIPVNDGIVYGLHSNLKDKWQFVHLVSGYTIEIIIEILFNIGKANMFYPHTQDIIPVSKERVETTDQFITLYNADREKANEFIKHGIMIYAPTCQYYIYTYRTIDYLSKVNEEPILIARFKRFSDAIEAMRPYNNREALEEIATRGIPVDDSKYDYAFVTMCKLILNGVPNGYPYAGSQSETFEKMCKQPKQAV